MMARQTGRCPKLPDEIRCQHRLCIRGGTWHSVDPVGAEVETRDSILLTYFVDAGVLGILRNRGKRIGKFLRSKFCTSCSPREPAMPSKDVLRVLDVDGFSVDGAFK
jgi:hypothetical protein